MCATRKGKKEEAEGMWLEMMGKEEAEENWVMKDGGRGNVARVRKRD